MEIAVVSGKGGTGKSSISAALVSLTNHSIAVDCDVDAANMYLLFQPKIEKEFKFISGKYALIDQDKCIQCGKCKSLCRFDAISIHEGQIEVDTVLCEGCSLCSRICPVKAICMKSIDQSRMYIGSFRYGRMVYGRLFPGEENSGKFVSVIRQHAHRLAEEEGFPNIILDGPPGIGCPVISTLTGADKAVIVTEPSLSGLSDMKRVINVARNFIDSIYVIINKYDLNVEMSEKIKLYCLQSSIPVVAELPFDKRVVEAMVAGRTIIESYPDSLVATRLMEVYRIIFEA